MIAFLCQISCVLHSHPMEIKQFLRKRKNKTNLFGYLRGSVDRTPFGLVGLIERGTALSRP